MKKKKFIVVVAGLIERSGKILMAQRCEKMNPEAHLMWELPGGVIDFGEKPETALLREIKEETGFPIKIIKQIPLTVTKLWKYPGFLQHTLLLVYQCKIAGKQRPIRDKEIKTVTWKKIGEIDYSKTLPGTKESIECLKR